MKSDTMFEHVLRTFYDLPRDEQRRLTVAILRLNARNAQPAWNDHEITALADAALAAHDRGEPGLD